MPAPIALFTYKRLATLRQTVTALQQNHQAKESELFVFSDGPKKVSDKAVILEIRDYLKTISGFKRVTIRESLTNKGLAASVISGVTQVINQFGKVIVLEDDLITTPNFIAYMNNCLNRFENNQRIFSVSGYSFNLGKQPQDYKDTYFLNRGWSWGWATWKDRWEQVDWAMNDYSQFCTDRQAQRAFAEGGSDLNAMLQKQMSGQLDSWAIRWFYHQFKQQGLTVYPVLSKIYNDGFDDNATHTSGSSNRYRPLMDREYSTLFSFPNEAAISLFYQERFQQKMGVKARIRSKVESILKHSFRFVQR
jgi:hypothetical protein